MIRRLSPHTQQNPTPQQVADARTRTGDIGDPKSKPDYLIEGRVFDCFAPSVSKPVRGVWKAVEEKTSKGQAQRMVINLQDWHSDLAALRQQFADWPIDGLKEVKAITSDGKIVQIGHAGKA